MCTIIVKKEGHLCMDHTPSYILNPLSTLRTECYLKYLDFLLKCLGFRLVASKQKNISKKTVLDFGLKNKAYSIHTALSVRSKVITAQF